MRTHFANFLFPIILKFLQIYSVNCQNSTTTPSPIDTQISSKRVPGCPDLEFFQRNSFDSLNSGQLSKITCLCGPGHAENGEELEMPESNEERSTISVTCIYGSALADLERILCMAGRVNKSVERIVLNHVQIEDGNDFLTLFSNSTLNFSQLRHLEVKKCRGGPLNLGANSTLENAPKMAPTFAALEAIVLEECELGEMPTGLLARAPRVKSLSLANNRIQAIGRGDLVAGRQSLENLNLAGNLLSKQIEPGSLSQLEALKNLEIGEHNFASDALLAEIGQLENLESLDMSQMDGVEKVEQFVNFKNMTKLKRLLLNGCNLKVLPANSFMRFPALDWLDLRVNLIEKLEAGCFSGLPNLHSLTLAGNFLRFPLNFSPVKIPKFSDLPNGIWPDLVELESLDLGWNDFRALNKTSFLGLPSTMERLNLRNNEALRTIEAGAFDGLRGLRALNLSSTLLGRVPSGMWNLTKLKELDLSNANLSSIEPNAFDSIKPSLELLNLASNSLTGLDGNLLRGMDSLKWLDLSENRWLCDAKMQQVAEWIDSAYKRAADEKHEFELRHGLGTLCDRPYTRRGQSIFDLLEVDPEELAYDERVDTTTVGVPNSTLAVENGGGGLFGENATIDWKSITLLVGSAGDEHLNFTALEEENRRDDAKKPRYDINTVKYGQKSVTRREANTWLSGVIVTLLVVVTAFCIIIVARRSRNTDERSDEKEEEELKRRKMAEMEKEDEAVEEKDQSHQKPVITAQSMPNGGKIRPQTDTDLEQNCATTTF